MCVYSTSLISSSPFLGSSITFLILSDTFLVIFLNLLISMLALSLFTAYSFKNAFDSSLCFSITFLCIVTISQYNFTPSIGILDFSRTALALLLSA